MIAASTAWSIPADADELAGVRRDMADVAAQLGAPAWLQHEIAVAASEAVANAVEHAYRYRPPGAITVTVGLADERILVLVADDGDGFQVTLDDGEPGLGLAIIQALTDHVEVRDQLPSGTELVMEFEIQEE
jgi:serine/threonine-protein kinase RsbW